MRPSATPPGFPVPAELRAATPRRVGLPVLRSALCRRATPPTPVSDRPFFGRFLRRDPAAFPVLMAGRRSRFPFEACTGFTCVAAHRLADPPTWALVPRASTHRLPSASSRSLPGCTDNSPGRTRTGENTAPSTAHMRRVQLRGGARRQPARRTFCTLSRLSSAPTKQMGPYHRSSVSGARRRDGRGSPPPPRRNGTRRGGRP